MIETAVLTLCLKSLPEVSLSLLVIAREAVKEDGSLDEEYLAFHHKEVLEAKDEAEAYMADVQRAVRSLQELARGG
jgi:hypothetical protein